MKKSQFLSFLIFIALYGLGMLNASGRDGHDLKQIGIHGDHLEFYIPADQPDVYLDTSNAVIIIDGGGEVTYYDVQITSMTTWYVVISTVVSGYYDTIDVSSLTCGDYIITISSPTGHEFEGEFTIN